MSGSSGATGSRPAAQAGVPVRATRSDALRNRAKVLLAARELVAEAPLPGMEDVARRAGVGVGTVYRHFASRTELLQAVYLEDLEVLTELSDELVDAVDAWAALESWTHTFLRLNQAKRSTLGELTSAYVRDPARDMARDRIDAAAEQLMAHARSAGVVRDDLSGSDLAQLIVGMVASPIIDADRHDRLLAVILDGIRSRP